MKAYIVKARDNFKVGDLVEVEKKPFVELYEQGYAISEAEHNANEAVKAANAGRVTDAVVRAKARGAVPLKDEAVLAKSLERLNSGAATPEVLVELLDGMPSAQDNVLAARTTQFQADLNGTGRVQLVKSDPHDAAIKACELSKPMDTLIRAGRMQEAATLSKERTNILSTELMDIYRKGGDFSIKEMVRAADVTDANVGTIAGSLVLLRNLGFLENILTFMRYISTDLRSEPALFNQPVYTRYITPPAVSEYSTPTASGSGTTATMTGGWSDSTPSATDVTVTMNKHKGVQITYGTQLLGSTARALLAEQMAAQTYSLGETMVSDFLAALFGATWTGTVKKLSLGTFDMSKMVALKNRATLSKMPPIGRFALLHSYYHDGLLADTNLVTAKAIMALINKDMSAFESSELPVLYGIKPLETQLASYNSGTFTAPGINADTGAVSFAGINQVGFLGNVSSMLMVSRLPQDYTQAFPNIPATAAIEVVTSEKTGLSLLNCKFVNHQLASVSNRLSAMYGFGQGDPRQGIVLTP